MTSRSIVATVLDRAGSLERVVGLLRRRGFGHHRLSIGREQDGAWQVVVEIRGDDRVGERICAGLESLVDVTSVRTVLLPDEGQELVLAGIIPDISAEDSSTADFLLITGSPAEMDRTLARMHRTGKLRWSVRTGAIMPLPPNPSTGAEDSSTNEDQT